MVCSGVCDVSCRSDCGDGGVGYGCACVRVSVECVVAGGLRLAKWVYLRNDRTRGKFR